MESIERTKWKTIPKMGTVIDNGGSPSKKITAWLLIFKKIGVFPF
jgi:hypothetical protein